MEQKIYFDNGSTSWPKAPGVAAAMTKLLESGAFNINRGNYEGAYELENQVLKTRMQLARLFHAPDSRCVVFTPGITYSLNYLLKGLLKPGDHVLVSSLEHNAVMRPLVQLEAEGVTFDRIPSSADGSLLTEKAEELLRPNTRLLVCLHASNVCGTMMPVQELGNFCRKHRLLFILDTAQTAGTIPIDMEALHLDALAFTGHKGLRGPQGTGGFLIRNELASVIEPLLSGGTGSVSHTEEVPAFLPDRFEPGTPNIPGILGLHAALCDLEKTDLNELRQHELELTQYFIDGIQQMDPTESVLRVIGKRDTKDRTSVVSIQTLQIDMARAAYELDATYGIMTRVGLHCAPSAHKTLGTYPEGTIRFSFGPENTHHEVDMALQALAEITGTSQHL